MGTLTGVFRRGGDLAPVEGKISFTLAARIVADGGTESVVLVQEPVTAALYGTGRFEVELVACDSATLRPFEGTLSYLVREQFRDTVTKEYSIVPTGDGPWDIADLAHWDAPPGVVVLPSPGPAGPTAVSADAGNSATLGTDSLIYVPLREGSEVTIESLRVRVAAQQREIELLRADMRLLKSD